MSAIFTRHGLFLDAFYKWGVIHHLFPEWQFPAVLDLVDGWKDKPEGYAIVKGKSINLDTLEVVRL